MGNDVGFLQPIVYPQPLWSLCKAKGLDFVLLQVGLALYQIGRHVRPQHEGKDAFRVLLTYQVATKENLIHVRQSLVHFVGDEPELPEKRLGCQNALLFGVILRVAVKLVVFSGPRAGQNVEGAEGGIEPLRHIPQKQTAVIIESEPHLGVPC